MRQVRVPITKPYVGDEEKAAACNVLDSGWLTGGKRVKEFEEIVAEYVGAKYAVATGNCTQALHLALEACGIGKGHKVIVPSFTFPATANAVMHAGAEVVIMDVQKETYNMDWLTGKGYVYDHILPVDIFGVQCRLVGPVNDAACGIGSVKHRWGAYCSGMATCYSFHPRKVITTGEGGMLVTNDSEIADLARIMRDHGQHPGGKWITGGYNYRMTDIQAAIGIEQMKKLPYILQQRQSIAAIYDLELPEELKRPPEGGNYQSYVCTYDGDRDEVIRKLRECGVESSLGTYAVHRHHGMSDEDFPNSSYLCDHTLSLPIYPSMTDDEQTYVIDMLKEILR